MHRTSLERTRRGFTLVEVLVVIAIIGVLVGLLMPALQSARESARGAACANKLKQIGIAMAHYESSSERFPPGVLTSMRYGDPDPNGFHQWTSFLHMLLPQLDEQTYYDGIRGPRFPLASPTIKNVDVNTKNFAKVDGRGIPSLLCPSDTLAPDCWRAATLGGVRLAKSNYLGFFSGTSTGDGIARVRTGQEQLRPLPLHNRRAVFGYAQGTTTKAIKDGTTSTIAVAEYLRGVSDTDGRGAFWWNDAGMQFIHAANGPNPAVSGTVPNATNLNSFDRLHSRRDGVGANDPNDWGCYGTGDPRRGVSVASPNNQPRLNLPCAPGFRSGETGELNDEFASSRSRHPGGVYALFCDGHVDFMNDTVSSNTNAPYGTWQRLVWIDDGGSTQ